MKLSSATYFAVLLPILIFIKTGLAQQPAFEKAWLSEPEKYSKQLIGVFQEIEMPVYTQSPGTNKILLENGYLKHELPAIKWPLKAGKHEVTIVRMIVSLYPQNRKAWQTGFENIMARRLNALFNIAPSLNDKRIHFELILQTNCKNEEEAKKLFHGFEIVYKNSEPSHVAKPKEISVFDTLNLSHNDSLAWLNINKKIQRQLKKEGGITDSVVLKSLNNINTDSTLIVVDCTGSMGPYYQQVLIWLQENIHSDGQRMVLFNDAGSKPPRVIGKSGGYFISTFHNTDELFKALNKMRRSIYYNYDMEENNLEATLAGLERYPETKRVIMIADNISCVRDISLLNQIQVPIDVILCGTHGGINPTYLDIVQNTKGKLFSSFGNWQYDKSLKPGDEITISSNVYRLNKKTLRFEHASDNNRQQHQHCDKFYLKEKKRRN